MVRDCTVEETWNPLRKNHIIATRNVCSRQGDFHMLRFHVPQREGDTNKDCTLLLLHHHSVLEL